MARPRKGDPELLLVSFCDILTISISGLFMATIITVFEATKIPELQMVPRAIPTAKTPVFFECRGQQVFYINKDELDGQVARRLSQLNPGVRSGDLAQFLKAIQGEEIGNEHYRVDPKFLLVGVMALEPRAGIPGDTTAQLKSGTSRFHNALIGLDKEARYIAFLVRDDSFDVFRIARLEADKLGFDVGWELLGEDEPIKFGAGGTGVLPQ
ncbi:MAG: hypothetical protein RMM51_06575 [Verrucomicrobiae bacterium]|nr:hypothetical protein [Verrucomicrobiae bacterium]